MKSLLICSVVFMVISIVYGADNTIPKECPRRDSPKYTVHIAHEKDCSRFYKCQAGKKIPKEGLLCPKMKNGDRLQFNAVLQVCDWPDNLKCNIPIKPEDVEQPQDDGELLDDNLPEDSILSRLLI